MSLIIENVTLHTGQVNVWNSRIGRIETYDLRNFNLIVFSKNVGTDKLCLMVCRQMNFDLFNTWKWDNKTKRLFMVKYIPANFEESYYFCEEEETSPRIVKFKVKLLNYK